MHTRRTVVAVVAFCALFVSFLLLPEVAASEGVRGAAKPLAEMAVGAGRVDWQPAGDYEHLTLTVAGPAGIWIRNEFAAGQPASLSLFDQSGQQLPEGAYIYELRLVPRKAENIPQRPLLQAGSFAVRGGSFTATFEERKGPGDVESVTEHQIQNITAATEVIADDLVVQGHACIGDLCGANDADFNVLKLKDYYVGILFDDVADCCSYSRNWLLQANPSLGGPDHFFLQDVDAQTIPFSVQGGAPDYSLVVGSGGKIGIGTSIPGAPLHLYGSATSDAYATMGPDPAAGPAFNFGYSGTSFGRGSAFFNVRPDASATAPNPSLRFLTANVERMIVTNTGNVGLGTASPSNSLHVKRTDGTAQFLIEEASSTAAQRTLLRLDNNGGVQLFMRDRSAFGGTGVEWALQNVNAQARITDVGDSTNEMVLDQAGNATFAGTVTSSSSRTIKEELSAVDSRDVLRRVVELPITAWSYKATPGVRHVGPMSEDFFAAFAVGSDDQGISVTDSAGVALAAIQGLHHELVARDAEIADLRAQLEELAAQLEQLNATP